LEYGPATFHEKIKRVNVNKEKRDDLMKKKKGDKEGMI